jgi:hypothetical protein
MPQQESLQVLTRLAERLDCRCGRSDQITHPSWAASGTQTVVSSPARRGFSIIASRRGLDPDRRLSSKSESAPRQRIHGKDL